MHPNAQFPKWKDSLQWAKRIKIMNLQGKETEPFSWATSDAYSEVITAIQRAQAQSISVPQLSRFLGVKTTTLNARFRRHQTALRTVGRTNFVSRDLALHLAELHRYALMGWPTLQQASRLTGVKAGTIKARCEKGRLEGYVDLTKRLRINPAELEVIRRRGLENEDGVGNPELMARSKARLNGRAGRARPETKRAASIRKTGPARLDDSVEEFAQEATAEYEPWVPAAAQPEIQIITGKDYGLPEVENEAATKPSPARRGKEKAPFRLNYDPDKPFSVSACTVGQSISYGPHDGTIIGIINDPFCPKIHVRFPHHQHPLMREVLLRVEKRKTAIAA